MINVIHGDCLEAMRAMPDNSVDSIVTDPPYGLGFMGKAWDALPPGLEWAQECLRVLKPGGHLLAFGGTRTWHRLAVAVEDAGFEIRDSIAWMYGSGFPKSMDVSKAIDKAAGAERPRIPGTGGMHRGALNAPADASGSHIWTAQQTSNVPETTEAKQWEGWGTALKPAFEPVVMARKPFKGTVAANVLEHGTGALNIDGCRIPGEPVEIHKRTNNETAAQSMAGKSTGSTGTGEFSTAGRFPANVILDEDQAAALDEQSGILKAPRSNGSKTQKGLAGTDTFKIHAREQKPGRADDGGASRFFYVAKAPKKERPVVDGVAHPTVKPLALMRYLVKLVTPLGGVVLDPFAGSGTTLEAAAMDGFDVIGIERDADYLPLIDARIRRVES